MNNCIVFENKGVLDMRAVRVMGVSSKDTKSPIGFFGTGLKYAIAICLREKMKFDLYNDGVHYRFFVKRETMRNDEFDFCFMQVDGKPEIPLPFTTALGKNWKVWQAFRELTSNTMDEGGTVTSQSKPLKIHAGGHVTIVVSGDAMSEAYKDRDNICLSAEPVAETALTEFHSGVTNNIFYRGVVAGKLSKPAMFTHNVIDPQTLTEDRTFLYQFSALNDVALSVAKLEDDAMIHAILMAGPDFQEFDLDFSGIRGGETFNEVVEANLKDRRMNASAYTNFIKARPGAALVDSRDPTEAEAKVLARAQAFCIDQLKLPVNKYEILISDNLRVGVVGHAKNGKIYLSSRAFDIGGVKYVAQTLIEEYVHLQYAVADETRAMQDILIELLVKAGERLLEEPL